MSKSYMPASGADEKPMGPRDAWPIWHARLFGTFEVVSTYGQLARISSRKSRALLAYLCLLPDREFSNEQIGDLFWPEVDGDRQAQNLRRAIADLRKVLERDRPLGSVIATRKGHLSLARNAISTDVERFRELVEWYRREPTASALSELVELYRGPLLVNLGDGWTMPYRHDFEESFSRAVSALCVETIEQGDAQGAIATGRAAVLLAPGREAVHVALIRAYAAAGMSEEALRQYEELERILDETWGERPSRKASEALESAFRDRYADMHNLPEALTSFIGRQNEIKDVCRLLGHARLLTLTGSGGCGKTRLSLEVARGLLGDYLDGVWFADLSALENPEFVPRAVASAVGVVEHPGVPILQTLIHWLKTKRLLVVLDNCEHLVMACAKLAQSILNDCPRVQILATSREPLAVDGEIAFRVPSLPVPELDSQHTATDLLAIDSVKLFLDRAKTTAPGLALNGKNMLSLASIVRQLDGIPLAVELAAARARFLTVEEIDLRIADRFRILTGGTRTALPRHQTLRSLIDWSYNLLSEHEKALLRRLSVFAGGSTLGSATAVCSGELVREESVLDLLASLCDKSLSEAETLGGEARFNMLQTIQQYARERLHESGEAELIQSRHLAHVVALCQEAKGNLWGPNQLVWLGLLDSEQANIRAAIEWALSSGRSDSALLIAEAVWRFWYIRGESEEAIKWLRAVVAANLEGLNRGHLAGVLTALARFAWSINDLSLAETCVDQSLLINRSIGNLAGAADALNVQGNVRLGQDDPEGALLSYEEALEASLASSHAHGIGRAMLNLSRVAIFRGNPTKALGFDERALAIYRDIGCPFDLAIALNNSASTLRMLWDSDRARFLGLECLALRFQLRDWSGVGSVCNILGLVELDCSNLAEARNWASTALRHTNKEAYHPRAMSLSILGEVFVREGDRCQALAMFHDALELFGGLRSTRDIVRVLGGIAAIVENPSLSARLWGVIDRARETAGSPPSDRDSARQRESVAAARAAMGDDAFDLAWQAGRAATLESSIEWALQACLTTP